MRSMKAWGVLLAATCFLAAPATCRGATVLANPDPVLQGYIDHSRVPTPNVTLTILFSACPGMDSERSCTGADTPTTIWLSHYADFTHELGHVFDYNVMTDAYRAGFEKILGDTRPWRSAPNSPHERFAEAYRLCGRYARLPRYVDVGYGLSMSPRQFTRVCSLIRRAAAHA